MPSAITFDIETIPQEIADFTEIQKEEFERLLEGQIKRHDGAKTEEEISSLIRGTNPFFGKIICIGAHKWFKGEQGETEKLKLFSGDERDLLEKFFKAIKGFKGVFVHFNGLDFDVPFIVKRALHHQLKPQNDNFNKLRRFSPYPHFDVMQHVANWDRYNKPSLHMLADHLGIRSPKEGEVKASEVYTAWKEGRAQEIYDYCLRDVESTYQIYRKIKPWYD